MRHFLLHAPQRDDTPGSAYGSPMTKINNASRETQLYLHTLASSLACATQTPMPVFQISGPREDSPSAQRVRVLEQLDETLTGLDTVIRSKKVPPVGEPVATLGRRLIERGEVYDAVNKTYAPGPGFAALLDSLTVDAVAKLADQAIADGTISTE
ncbi:Uncharacterised protein [Mycobacteroides abscessus]|uniref:Uncharacterized protein n=4 Tax=Mycobacteroides TaxID=670516 RepID=A0AB74FHE6_9MYCO|nr:Uncharacterised protein [Mycobacteroides abscessus]SHY00377.1 Uncharacterised protein [Mycobacteroides abscessus subsp. abscessus]SKD20537.1 Uncharacterised protein [Mycobacteroides abscessus subsp. massiliense]CPT92320.1 Uncharacterised protein [Mycobacteroides abscessus]CPU15232.1 Uncharacterised protein [Mycobacteroides abscessus]